MPDDVHPVIFAELNEFVGLAEVITVFLGMNSLALHAVLGNDRVEMPLYNPYGGRVEAGLRENLKNVVAQNCRLGILVLFEQVIPKYMDLADQYNLEMTVLQRSIPVTALMSKSHPLANSSRVSLKDLTGYPFIADAHIDPDDTLDVLGRQSHTDLLYICDRGTIFDAVRKGNYIAIGISIPEEDARRMNCVCCPIADGAPMAVALLHSRTFTLRPREKHFIRYLTGRLHKRYSG